MGCIQFWSILFAFFQRCIGCYHTDKIDGGVKCHHELDLDFRVCNLLRDIKKYFTYSLSWSSSSSVIWLSTSLIPSRDDLYRVWILEASFNAISLILFLSSFSDGGWSLLSLVVSSLSSTWRYLMSFDFIRPAPCRKLVASSNVTSSSSFY